METANAFTQAFASSAKNTCSSPIGIAGPAERQSQRVGCASASTRNCRRRKCFLNRELESIGCAHIENQKNEIKHTIINEIEERRVRERRSHTEEMANVFWVRVGGEHQQKRNQLRLKRITLKNSHTRQLGQGESARNAMTRYL